MSGGRPGRARPGALPLELWGGVECTVNRVGDTYFDQLERTGHAARADDLDRIAALGVRALRYPVLWERTMPDDAEPRWAWSDARLARLRELGVRPVVGLLHHGSGPRHTNLLDPRFPALFADYARRVAERYPWVNDWTPINEPLTTARFGALYALWFPHRADDHAFARALFNQCRAIALAMREIRAVNPGARLVQTEDLGKTHSTRALAYQARFENARRWLTMDMLCGRLAAHHPLWGYLRRAGIDEEEMLAFAAEPCPPDILGVNHYLTSERFLDTRLRRYPPEFHGGNGIHRYADVEAVRVVAEGPAGPRALLREAWKRYHIPLAVTEAHLGCTREEQMRWLLEIWESAHALRRDGADVRAVTAWSLLGAFDWASLMTRAEGRYEPGAFDVRTGDGEPPRATALAALARELAAGIEPSHPTLAGAGWWRRPSRLLYAAVRCRRARETTKIAQAPPARLGGGRPLLIAGARGTLGHALARQCDARGIDFALLARDEMDIADAASVNAALDGLRPWAVINAAGYVRVDDAEREPERCLRENRDGAATLAAACARAGLPLVTFSTDLVFDGARDAPYVEHDEPTPLGVYGRSKADAERRVLEAHPDALVVRTAAFFGPWDEYNFVTLALRTLARRQPFIAASDLVVSPTYVPDLAHAVLDLLIDGDRGVRHLTNRGAVTWADLARHAASLVGFDPSLVDARPAWSLGLGAPRPRYAALGTARGWIMPDLDHGLYRYIHHPDRRWTADEPVQETRISAATT